MALLDILDPLDLGGRGAAEGAVRSAKDSAAILREFFDKSQENLQPFLDVSQAQLPGLEASATPEGFFGEANALRPIAQGISDDLVNNRLRDFNASLGAAGATRSGGAISGAADIQEQADLAVLLELNEMLQGRRQRIAGQGGVTGGNLSRLGQSAAEQLADVQASGFAGAGAAKAAGAQNFINLAALGSQFIPRGGVDIDQTIANNPATLGTITPQR